MQWDEWGGVGQSPDIAVIAHHRRDLKGRILPRIDADERGSESEGIWDEREGVGGKNREIAVIG
jgi:hypothetical protein